MIHVDLEYAAVVFTTRQGGVSEPPFDTLNLGAFSQDNPEAVARNIDIVRESLDIDDLHGVYQVHGGNVLNARNIPLDAPSHGDGIYTDVHGEAVMVTGADCPPVALASRDRVVILHCGWRSLAAEIVERGAALLDAKPFEAAIGPGIGADHYEVGQEVIDALGPDGVACHVNGRLSLSGVIARKLERLGASRVEHVDRCTYSEPKHFFSHRRDGAPTGRQAGITWRR